MDGDFICRASFLGCQVTKLRCCMFGSVLSLCVYNEESCTATTDVNSFCDSDNRWKMVTLEMWNLLQTTTKVGSVSTKYSPQVTVLLLPRNRVVVPVSNNVDQRCVICVCEVLPYNSSRNFSLRHTIQVHKDRGELLRVLPCTWRRNPWTLHREGVFERHCPLLGRELFTEGEEV